MNSKCAIAANLSVSYISLLLMPFSISKEHDLKLHSHNLSKQLKSIQKIESSIWVKTEL